MDPRFSSQSPSVLILFVVAWLDVVLSILCLAVGATQSSHTPLCHNARPLSAETCFYSEGVVVGGVALRVEGFYASALKPLQVRSPARRPSVFPTALSVNHVNERMNDNHVFFANVTPNSLNCP